MPSSTDVVLVIHTYVQVIVLCYWKSFLISINNIMYFLFISCRCDDITIDDIDIAFAVIGIVIME